MLLFDCSLLHGCSLWPASPNFAAGKAKQHYTLAKGASHTLEVVSQHQDCAEVAQSEKGVGKDGQSFEQT